MSNLYNEEDYLLLSGIQHYAFCPRQWALIHIEELWLENYLTATGRILHANVHDGDHVEKRGDLMIFRSLRVHSKKLGIIGECDVVEFRKSKYGVPLFGYEGLWMPFPVEYKRGKGKLNNCDRLQLCAQAVCLEESLCVEIKRGAIFYGEPRRREVVDLSHDLRAELSSIVNEMHSLFSRKHTPKAIKSNYCKSCSLKIHCIPSLDKAGHFSVRKYMEEHFE